MCDVEIGENRAEAFPVDEAAAEETRGYEISGCVSGIMTSFAN